MANWWDNVLSSYQQVLFIIAVSTTLIMLIQIIITFVGAGDDPTFDGVDGEIGDIDFDGGDGINDGGFGMIFGLRVLSIRGALAFFALGSWVTFVLYDVMNWWGATILGVVCGVAAAFLIAYAIKSIEKLQSSGNVETKNAIGKNGEVYLTIPAKGEGSGKVNVLVQERLSEFNAVTEKGEAIKTGSMVKIVGVLNDSTLVVE